jgi:hypothetical protein
MKKIIIIFILLIIISCLNGKKLNNDDRLSDLNLDYMTEQQQIKRNFDNFTGFSISNNSSLKTVLNDNQKINTKDELIKNVFRYIFIGK